MDVSSLFFGFFLGVFIFTTINVTQQTRAIWRRTKSLHNAYLYMIWIEAWVNFAYAFITFLYLNGVIEASLGFFVPSIILWTIHTQMLLQIVANRIALIMTNKLKARNMKIALLIGVGCINISIGYIWVIAHLPSATPSLVSLNHILDKVNKILFLLINLSVDLYFLYLVRFRLIADGLSKYWRLFKFNIGIVVLSTTMDVLLFAFLDMPNTYMYVQFASVAYIVKLQIELQMASLISKVVRSGAAEARDGWHGSSSHKPNQSHQMTSRVVISGSTAMPGENDFFSKLETDGLGREGSSGSETQLTTYPDQNGIMKTVETTIVVRHGEDGDSDRLHV